MKGSNITGTFEEKNDLYIARQHLYYKCETGNKNRRESNTEAKFRKTLSFLLYMSDILCCAKSDIALRAVILFGYASQCYSIRLKTCAANNTLFEYLAFGEEFKKNITAIGNITRHRRIELA